MPILIREVERSPVSSVSCGYRSGDDDDCDDPWTRLRRLRMESAWPTADHLGRVVHDRFGAVSMFAMRSDGKTRVTTVRLAVADLRTCARQAELRRTAVHAVYR